MIMCAFQARCSWGSCDESMWKSPRSPWARHDLFSFSVKNPL